MNCSGNNEHRHEVNEDSISNCNCIASSHDSHASFPKTLESNLAPPSLGKLDMTAPATTESRIRVGWRTNPRQSGQKSDQFFRRFVQEVLILKRSLLRY